jgi:hypothetical protein
MLKQEDMPSNFQYGGYLADRFPRRPAFVNIIEKRPSDCIPGSILLLISPAEQKIMNELVHWIKALYFLMNNNEAYKILSTSISVLHTSSFVVAIL